MPRHDAIQYPIEEIRQLIAQGWTQQQIATKLADEVDQRITAKLIYKVCKKHDIKCQRTGPRSGAGHPEWTGGRISARGGYVKVYCPDHPKCQRATAARREKNPHGYVRRDCYVLEHRLVMEKHLGRYLDDSEVVHHKNGVTNDNRIENLELFDSNGKHLAATLKGCVPKWTDEGKRRMGWSEHLISAKNPPQPSRVG